MKRLGVFMLPPGWDASPSQGYPQHYAGTHLYTWVERSTVRVKCLAQEHNTISPARPRTRTTRSGVEHTNHEATAPQRPPRLYHYYYTTTYTTIPLLLFPAKNLPVTVLKIDNRELKILGRRRQQQRRKTMISLVKRA